MGEVLRGAFPKHLVAELRQFCEEFAEEGGVPRIMPQISAVGAGPPRAKSPRVPSHAGSPRADSGEHGASREATFTEKTAQRLWRDFKRIDLDQDGTIHLKEIAKGKLTFGGGK